MFKVIIKIVDTLPHLIVTMQNNQFGAKSLLALFAIGLAFFALFVALQLMR